MTRLLVLVLLWALMLGHGIAGTLLPNARQQFFGQNGVPLVGGTVTTYIPGTSSPKTTWQDSGGTVPNSNPITLDSLGSAQIYGNGCYREVVRDMNSVQVWDQLTCDTSSSGNLLWAGISTGTPNAQIGNATGFSQTDGQAVSFMAGYTNTGAMTFVAAPGDSAIPVVKDTGGGQLALVAGDIVAGNIYTLTYSSSSASFHVTTNSAQGIPTGTSMDWWGSTTAIPSGWLLEDGSCVSQTLYANLFSILGLNYGSYCGTGQFPLPDTRGRVVAGVDVSPNTGTAGRLTSATQTCLCIGGAGGSELLYLSIAQLPVTTFTPSGTVVVSFPGGASYNESIYSLIPGGTAANITGTIANSSQPTGPIGPTSFTLNMNSSTFGSGAATPIVQPTIQSYKIIKF